eukprot:6186551-Pleurochrysis_carterae.AAC.2
MSDISTMSEIELSAIFNPPPTYVLVYGALGGLCLRILARKARLAANTRSVAVRSAAHATQFCSHGPEPTVHGKFGLRGRARRHAQRQEIGAMPLPPQRKSKASAAPSRVRSPPRSCRPRARPAWSPC